MQDINIHQVKEMDMMKIVMPKQYQKHGLKRTYQMNLEETQKQIKMRDSVQIEVCIK